jgi:hypothetical protein
MTDIQARLAEINKRVAPLFEEHVRLTDAVNKAITLILAMVAVGVLTFIAIAPTEQSLKTKALDQQEQYHANRN